jgi:hypothetical protein
VVEQGLEGVGPVFFEGLAGLFAKDVVAEQLQVVLFELGLDLGC